MFQEADASVRAVRRISTASKRACGANAVGVPARPITLSSTTTVIRVSDGLLMLAVYSIL